MLIRKPELTIKEILPLCNYDLALPHFQRDYVWNKKDVINFLDSLNKNWPTGLIIVWETKTHGRHLGSLWDQSRENRHSKGLILDGQQRLTTLKVLKDRGFLVLKSEDGNREQYFFYYNKKEKIFTSNTEQQDSLDLVDMTDILNEKVDSNFLTYKIPVKIVYPNNNEEAIKIFNRVNTSGKKIDNVVIAFAYIKDKYPKIATEIINFQRRCIERGFDLSDRVLMNCFIVVNKIKETDWSPSTRRPDKLIIDYLTSCNRNIEKDWENTFSRVKDALSFLRRNAGYDSDQFLTADNIIISLTGYLEVNDLGHKISSQKRNYLRKWLYRTILLGRYSITSNYTQDLKDLNKKKRFYNSEKMTRLKFENEYKPEGIISLMYAMGILNKMKDYNSNLISWSISRNNSERIHVDHIYPRSKLTKEPILGEIEEDIYDDFGNKAFIMGDDNSSKNKKFLGDEILDSRISQWIDREKFLSETDYQNMLKDKKKLLESCREIEEFVYRRHKKIIKNIQNII